MGITGWRPLTFTKLEAPQQMQSAAARFEQIHNVCFETLTWFSREVLAELQRVPPTNHDGVPESVTVARPSRAVADALALVRRTANTPAASLTKGDRTAYLNAFSVLLRALPLPESSDRDPSPLWIAPEREGHQLALDLGRLPAEQSWTPNAKRIPFDGGLVVGLSNVGPGASAETLLIDGVIASGATVIAVINALRPSPHKVQVFSGHATTLGLWAIHRYARQDGISLQIHVGAVSGVLNTKFYAVDAKDHDSLLIGDVGDTIAGVAPALPASTADVQGP